MRPGNVKRQRRLEARKKQRERERRAVRRRRAELDRCTALVLEAQAVWHYSNDTGEARRLLDKALRIRPGSQLAHERLAELDFRDGRPLDGLQHYDQLTRPPEWPPLIYMAAGAAFQVGRLEQARALAQAFGRLARGVQELAPLRQQARQLAESCRVRGRSAAPSKPGSAQSPQRAVHGGTTRQPMLAFERSASNTAAMESQGRAGRIGVEMVRLITPQSHRDEPVAHRPSEPDPPDLPLPPFPGVALPDLAVQFDAGGHDFLAGLDGNIGPLTDVLLRRDFATLRLLKGFDELISLGSLTGVEHFWYQLETVRRLLRDFRGRLLLADEVGLGKTIEACLALKEYWLRGLVTKALILTPASLVGQWVDELGSKFGLSARPAEVGKVTPDHEIWAREAIVVASLPLVRQRAYRARLTSIDYDLVIVDEAHVLGNRASAAWQLVNELKKRFILLLSATPVGNDLSELYNLILLLKPGLLQTEARFRADFGRLSALAEPARRERLRTLLREVMIRNTRAHIDVRLPRRLAATELVTPTAAEIVLQEQLLEYVGGRYGKGGKSDQWSLMSLQMQAGSSPAALRAAIDRREPGPAGGDLERLRAIAATIDRPAKTSALLALLRRSNEKAIVFTRFRATVDHLQAALEGAGFRVATVHGGLAAAEKQAAIAGFETEAQVLVSSEVGGEGRNLQFCRTVVNYDLPWNPVQLEQRVGRVHRIGQTRDVFVFNLCLAGSLEQHVLTVLHDKLNLFELVAGEIEMILGEFDHERDFAELVMDLWARSSTDEERKQAFGQFADDLMAARERYRKTQEIDRALFREEFEV